MAGISGTAAGKVRMMKKHEKNPKESDNEKSDTGHRTEGFEAWYDMINRCCEDLRGTRDCCSGMRNMWEKMQDKSQEDGKPK